MKKIWQLQYEPGEESSAKLHIHGDDYYMALWDFAQKIRTHYKHGDYEKEATDLVEKIRDEFYECLADHDIDL